MTSSLDIEVLGVVNLSQGTLDSSEIKHVISGQRKQRSWWGNLWERLTPISFAAVGKALKRLEDAGKVTGVGSIDYLTGHTKNIYRTPAQVEHQPLDTRHPLDRLAAQEAQT